MAVRMCSQEIALDGIISEPYDETQLGTRSYELTNHLGNVMAVIVDKKPYNGSNWEVEVRNAYDYYPFGMLMPERKYAIGDEYRFGFGSFEKDDEVKGAGNFCDMGARIYDPRIGRTLTQDPAKQLYPGISPYAYGMNSPIQAIDPDGKVVIFINGLWGPVN